MKILIKSIIQPLLRRAGTALSGYLVAQGVSSDTTTTIVTGLTAAILVALDLVLSHLNKKGRQ